MHPYSRDYPSRARTVDPSASSFISSRTTAIPTQFEPREKMSGDASKPSAASGLTKTEAEDLLDCLEAAGYELCQLSYVNGEGYSIRLPLGTTCTARSKA